MTLTERLRSVVRSGGVSLSGSRGEPDGFARQPAAATADVLGGEWREWQGQHFLVVDRRYPPGHRHGRSSVADGAPDAGGGWPGLAVLDPALRGGRLLFIDLETTGLSGGAGTYAFLVGCGWFEGAAFRVRQLLLAAFAAERGLLEAMVETASGVAAIATYNGKTFDLPVLDTRCLLHRMATPFEAMSHIDLLHPARQLWKSEETRLSTVEATVLGCVRDGDVPGFEIPSRYFHYVRSGDPRPLAGVLEHNRLDLLSLAMLTARLAQLLEQGVSAASTAREALGLGRIHQRGGRLMEARRCFARALEMDGDAAARAEALRAYALLCRRSRDHAAAAAAWQELLDLPACPPHVAHEAREALAVHCEHRLRDFQRAHRFAVESLRRVTSAVRADKVRHRVARLDRKLAAPLF